jgi:hypothetical protein
MRLYFEPLTVTTLLLFSATGPAVSLNTAFSLKANFRMNHLTHVAEPSLESLY